VQVAAAGPRQARRGFLTRSVADPEGGEQVGAALRRVALMHAIQHFRAPPAGVSHQDGACFWCPGDPAGPVRLAG
jgi:hypothetical protein